MFELPDLSKYLKFYNLFTYLYLKYFKGRGANSLELADVYNYTTQQAEKNGESATLWDVFDGVMWICTFVGVITTAGFIRSIL